MGLMRFAGNRLYLYLLKTGILKPPMQRAFFEAEPKIAVELVGFFEAVGFEIKHE